MNTNSFESTTETMFAPAERASAEIVQRQFEYFIASNVLPRFLDGISQFVVVLNNQRQIVFANRSLINFLQIKHPLRILGMRPGEALGCQHSYETKGGCGTTEFCSMCGAVKAILNSQRGVADVQECRITQEKNNVLDLRVWATPITVNSEPFTIFTVSDIGDEKRRRVLERIFFHDILNTASGLHGFSDLLEDAPPDRIDEIKTVLHTLSERLIEEINAQRELSAAESDELAIHAIPFPLLPFLFEVKSLYMNHDAAKAKNLIVNKNAVNAIVNTDRTLLRRVIGYLVKNALEASNKHETVTLHSEEKADGIEISVHNQGCIPRDIQLQIFQRSFSTKGNGRGLGTYSIKLLGERYLKGMVSFSSLLDDGTTFRILLPKEI